MRENNKDKGRPRLARLPATNAAHDHAEIQTVGGLSAKQSPTFTQSDGRENLEKFWQKVPKVMTEQKPKRPPCLTSRDTSLSYYTGSPGLGVSISSQYGQIIPTWLFSWYLIFDILVGNLMPNTVIAFYEMRLDFVQHLMVLPMCCRDSGRDYTDLTNGYDFRPVFLNHPTHPQWNSNCEVFHLRVMRSE